MTPQTGGPTTEAPAQQQPNRLARAPLWARIVVPVVVVAGGAAAVAGVVAAGAQTPTSVESMCRSAIETMLEARGHSDVDVARSLRVTEADGAYRVSGTVTSVNESGASDHAQLRCVVRVDDDTMRVVSTRLSD
jgi:hypothetical protein